MPIDLQKLEQQFNALFEDENIITEFEQWLKVRSVSQNSSKPIVSRRFMFQYKSCGREFYVTLKDENMNRAIQQFAKKYHQIEQVFSIEEVAKNGG